MEVVTGTATGKLVTTNSVTTELALVTSKLSLLLRKLSALKANETGNVSPAYTDVTLTLKFSMPTITGAAEMSLAVDKVKVSLSLSDVSTTMIYTHVLNKGGRGVVSPLDGLH